MSLEIQTASPSPGGEVGHGEPLGGSSQDPVE